MKRKSVSTCLAVMIAAGRYFSSGKRYQKTIEAIARIASTAVAAQNPRFGPTASALFSTKSQLSPKLNYRSNVVARAPTKRALREPVSRPCKLPNQPIDVRDRGSDDDRVGPRVECRACLLWHTNPSLAYCKRLESSDFGHEVKGRQGVTFGPGGVAA